MPCVYVLYSRSRKKFYVGSSHKDTSQYRLVSHNAGKTRSTKGGRPWELVTEERYDTYKESRQRELFLKSGQGRKWIKEKLTSERWGGRVDECTGLENRSP